MEFYFCLDMFFYFFYFYLVCCIVIEEVQVERKDDSYLVYVDNCILNVEIFVCVKEFLVYIFWDYSVIFYLNGDFDGGNFYFIELDVKIVMVEV